MLRMELRVIYCLDCATLLVQFIMTDHASSAIAATLSCQQWQSFWLLLLPAARVENPFYLPSSIYI